MRVDQQTSLLQKVPHDTTINLPTKYGPIEDNYRQGELPITHLFNFRATIQQVG